MPIHFSPVSRRKEFIFDKYARKAFYGEPSGDPSRIEESQPVVKRMTPAERAAQRRAAQSTQNTQKNLNATSVSSASSSGGSLFSGMTVTGAVPIPAAVKVETTPIVPTAAPISGVGGLFAGECASAGFPACFRLVIMLFSCSLGMSIGSAVSTEEQPKEQPKPTPALQPTRRRGASPWVTRDGAPAEVATAPPPVPTPTPTVAPVGLATNAALPAQAGGLDLFGGMQLQQPAAADNQRGVSLDMFGGMQLSESSQGGGTAQQSGEGTAVSSTAQSSSDSTSASSFSFLSENPTSNAHITTSPAPETNTFSDLMPGSSAQPLSSLMPSSGPATQQPPPSGFHNAHQSQGMQQQFMQQQQQQFQMQGQYMQQPQIQGQFMHQQQPQMQGQYMQRQPHFQQPRHFQQQQQQMQGQFMQQPHIFQQQRPGQQLAPAGSDVFASLMSTSGRPLQQQQQPLPPTSTKPKENDNAFSDLSLGSLTGL